MVDEVELVPVVDVVVVVLVLGLGFVVVVEVVVVVVVDDGDEFPPMRSPTDDPVPPWPKIEDSGFPASNSTAVTKSNATRNTTPAVPAMAFHVKRRGVAGANDAVVWIRRVAADPPPAVTSSGAVRSTACDDVSIWVVSSTAPVVAPDATCSVGAAEDWSTSVRASPPTAVDPSLRSTESSGARTTACLIASWPRSSDWATMAVPNVAAADPMATPTTVPLTPKADAMSAARTAPAAEARIWRSENFTGE